MMKPDCVRLVGVTYDDCQSQIQVSHEGDKVNLVREPDNPFDKKAIRVDRCGKKLGYISHYEACKIAPYMDKNGRCNGEIKRILGGGEVFYGIDIKIEYLDDEPQKDISDEYGLFDIEDIPLNMVNDSVGV